MKSWWIALGLLLACAATAQAPQIVAFLGPKRVGKDTCADYLARAHGYQKYSLADPAKRAVQGLFGFTDEQLWGEEKDLLDPFWEVTPREVLQYLGVDTLFHGLGDRFPHLGHSFYLRRFARWRKEHPDAPVVIADLRLQEDLDGIKAMGGMVIKLERPGLTHEDTHVSEVGVASVEGYDFLLVNNGTIEELESKIESLLCHSAP